VARKPEYITIGRMGRPRGVSGYIYISPATDDPGRFLELKEIFLTDQGRREKFQLEAAELVGGRPVVKIKGFDSREEAARLTNRSVEIPLAAARELPEGSYYQFDLIGCVAVGTDGVEYGVIEEVLFYPANDLYRIQSDRFGEVLLPVVDKFVVEVDIENGRVIIDPPEGLFISGEDNRRS